MLWLSTDPALTDYIPMAPVDDNAKKHNQNLPGMGGIYNSINMHLYHYAGNNPVKYTDPDGKYLQIFVSKSKGTMEVMYTKPGDKNTYAIADTTAVITNVNKAEPNNTKTSDTSRLQKNGTNPTQPANGKYKIIAAIAPKSEDGRYGSDEQGLSLDITQMLEIADAPINPETGKKETVTDTGYMIHITPWNYTDGCVGLPYDKNDSKSKAKAETLMNKLVDIYKDTMSKNGDKQAYIFFMD